MLKDNAKKILAANITKTMGCTDIGVVGYIASIGAYVLRHSEIKRVCLTMSEELYKNSVNVGVPGLHKSGLDKALALGLLIKNPKKQLAVFESVTMDDINRIDELLSNIEVQINYQKYDDTVLYEELHLISTNGDEVVIIIKDYYDNVVSVKRNGITLDVLEKDALIDRINKYKVDSFDDILDFVNQEDFSDLGELFRITNIQYENAREEIMKLEGDYLVENLSEHSKNCLFELSNHLRKHIEVPASKRMRGDIFTVYGVAGSGNLGLGTLITPMFIADALELSNDVRRQLIVLSFFTSVYVKQEMNVVTVLCGTGHATGCSAAAVITYAKKASNSDIKEAINIYLSSSMGFVCDGAKLSCTDKVGFAVMNGIIAGSKVLEDKSSYDGTGLNKLDVDQTIINLGKLNNDILKSANKGIIELI